MHKKLSQIKRLERIRIQLVEHGEVQIEDLASQLRVSPMTIRRDLEQIEACGDAIRTHGGAVMAKKLTFEFSFQDKQHLMSEAKQKIAACAAETVKPGHVVFLDTGTTSLEIARKLMAKHDITVITTSLAIISELQYAENLEVILLGGFLRKGSPDLHGPLTEQNVDVLRADIAFMGADAVDILGNTYTDDLRVVNLDRKMARNAASVMVVADSSKFNQTSMCKIFCPKDYDAIITDAKIGKKFTNQLRKNKINIKIA